MKIRLLIGLSVDDKIDYVTAGIAAILWLVVWSVLVTSTPGEQKNMSEKERNYILRSLKGQVSDNKSKVS